MTSDSGLIKHFLTLDLSYLDSADSFKYLQSLQGSDIGKHAYISIKVVKQRIAQFKGQD